MLSSFRKIVSKDSDLQRVQDNVSLVLNQLLPKEILDGVLVRAVVAVTPTVINHGLGRQPLGWLVVDRQPGIGGFVVDAPIVRTAWDERSITLSQPAGAGNVPLTIWVF